MAMLQIPLINLHFILFLTEPKNTAMVPVPNDDVKNRHDANTHTREGKRRKQYMHYSKCWNN